MLLACGEYCVPPLAAVDASAMIKSIRWLRNQCDRLIVSLHWGVEYVSVPSPSQQRLGRHLIEAGADLVVGHHSHVVAEVDSHGSGWIGYGLGNAALWVPEGADYSATRTGLQLRYNLQTGELSGQTLRLDEKPGRVSLDPAAPVRVGGSAMPSSWNRYLRIAGPIYLRSQAEGWRRRFKAYGPGQVRSLLRWLVSRKFLQMAWGCMLAMPRLRSDRG
jgi:poly-gamma-glutamate synthesis protein (capsule biosynthesis protein)